MVLRVVSSAAVRDDHGAVVSVDPQAAGRAARRHDDEDGDLHLHRVVSHGHGEVAVGGHDHTLALLLLQVVAATRRLVNLMKTLFICAVTSQRQTG